MPDVRINFRASTDRAKREMQQLRSEVTRLQGELGTTQQTSTRAAQGIRQAGRASQTAAQGVDRLGDEAQQAAIGVDTLGRNIFKTSAQAKLFGGIFQDQAGRLREANGRYTAASVGIRELTTGFGGAGRGATQFTESVQLANRGTGVFSSSLGNLQGILAGLGIAVVTHQLTQFSVESIRAAGSLDQLVRATTQIEGSAEAAEERIEALIQVANLPGLQFEPLVRYSNRLRAAGIAGEDVDKILLTVGQTVVSLGGSAATAELAMEQLIQAFQLGKIDMRDFRTVIQQIPGFMEAAADVHGVEANIEGLREAFNGLGGSLRDLLIPIFDELNRRFEAPPSDSYIVAIDTLENAFKLAQASLGGLLLPTVVQTAQALTVFFEAIRGGTKNLESLPEPIQEIIRGAVALYDGLQNVTESVGGVFSPSVRELASQLAGLLGAVLELTGALYNALEPILKGVYAVLGTVVAAVAQLVDHITLLVGGLTTAVEWVSQFWTEEERATASTDKLSEATEKLAEAQDKLGSSGDAQRANLRELQTELDETNARIERYTQRLEAADAAGVSNRSTQQFERLLATAKARVTELESEIQRLTETYGGATAALDANATEAEQNQAKLADLQTQLEGVNRTVADYEQRLQDAKDTAVGETNPSIQQLERRLADAQGQASGLQAEIDTLTDVMSRGADGADGMSQSTGNLGLELSRLRATAEDVRDDISNVLNIDNVESVYQRAIQASDAYYNRLLTNLQDQLAAEDEGSVAYQEIQNEIFQTERQREQARQALLNEQTAFTQRHAELQSQSRIETAERARDAEVRGYESAAASGASYAEELRALRTVSQRENFIELVNALQDQGLSFDEARQKAEEFFTSINAIPPVLQGADAAYGALSSTLQTESEVSALAVANLTGNVLALVDAIGGLSDDSQFRLDSSLERTLQTEQDYFDNLRPGSVTIESDQQAAGQQGRAFIERLLGTSRREAIREMRELTRDIENILRGVSDVFIDIARGQEIPDAFADLGERIGFSLLSAFETELSENLADVILEQISGAREQTGFLENLLGQSGGGGGAGGLAGLGGIGAAVAPYAIPIAALTALTYALVTSDDSAAQADNAANRAAGVDPITQAEARAFQAGGVGGETRGIPTDVTQPILDNAATQIEIITSDAADNIVEAFGGFYGITLRNLQENLDQASFNLNFAQQTGRGVNDAVQGVITAQTEFYQHQIDEINRVRRETGELSFGNAEELARTVQGIINDARLALESTSNVTRFTPITQQGRTPGSRFNAATGQFEQIPTAGSEALAPIGSQDPTATPEELEKVAADALASVIEAINEDVGLINASILSLETQINQVSEPDEIAALLEQIPDQIREKYRLLRESLQERFDAGDITEDVYNASLSELKSNEAAELERNSDAQLANTFRAINEDVQLIDASIQSIQTQIQQLSEPEAIAALLNQLPALIAEKYRGLRESLDEKYAAGEVSTDVYNASLTQLNSSESAELEQQSDAVLANALSEIDDDVALIDAEIGALQLAVSNSDDPEAIAGILDAIKILVADKYKRLRERLDEVYAAEEISTDAYNAALLGLSTAESRALADIDTQALNSISAEAQDRVNFINGAIENLRQSLQLTDDPAGIQSILEAIKVLTAARFDALRAELEVIRDTLKPEEYAQALEGLNLGEQLALENLDTEKFDAVSEAAAEQVAFINGNIENLRLAIQLTDDPAEQQQILDAIKILVMARFDVLREELEKIRETLSDAEYNQALTGLNLGEQLALENLDTEKFDLISQEAQRQVGLINGTIENLRLSLQLTDDPTESQQILDAIKILTAKRFDVLIQELKDIEENLEPDEFDRALKGLELGKEVALDAIDTEKFQIISAEAQRQVSFINGAIENLRLSLQLADDPSEVQSILEAIKTLTRGRFAILRKELEDIRETLKPEEYQQALEGLNLGEQLAIENLDTEKFNAISAEAQRQVAFINTSVENLRLSLQLTDDPTEIQQILDAIKILTAARFDVLRDELESIRENLTDGEYNQALRGLNLGEQVALKNLDAERFSAISAEAQKQVQFIEGAIDNLRLSLQLTNDPAEIQLILDAIKVLVGARFDVLIDELKALESTLDPAQFQQALTGLQLGRQVAIKGIDSESLGNTISQINTGADLISNQIDGLSDEIRNSDDPAEIQSLVVDLRGAIQERHRLQREVLQKQLDAEQITIDQYNAELGSLNRQESSALIGADRLASDEISNLRTTANNLIQNAIERGEYRLGRATSEQDFENIRTDLLQLTNQYYDNELERINGLMLSEQELQNSREDNALKRIRAVTRIEELENQFAADQLRRERERQDNQRRIVESSTQRAGGAFRGTRNSLEDFFREDFGIDLESFLNEQGEDAAGNSRLFQFTNQFTSARGGDRNRVLREFGLPSLGAGLSEGQLNELLQIGREYDRAAEEIGIQRQHSVALESIAAEESNNAWKADIATIAANTAAQTDAEGIPELLSRLNIPESIADFAFRDLLPTEIPQSETPDVDDSPIDVFEVSGLDTSPLADFGVTTQQFLEDAALLTPATEHLVYFSNEMPLLVENLAVIPQSVDTIVSAAAASAQAAEGYAAQARAILATLAAFGGGGGGGGFQLNVGLNVDGAQLATAVDGAAVSVGASGGLVGGLGGGGGGAANGGGGGGAT